MDDEIPMRYEIKNKYLSALKYTHNRQTIWQVTSIDAPFLLSRELLAGLNPTHNNSGYIQSLETIS